MVGLPNFRQGELLRAVFAELLDYPDGLPGRQVMDGMARRVPLSEYELGYYQSSPGEPRAYKATRFMTINCVKAGWLIKTKGRWTLTEEGVDAYHRISDPAEFLRESSRLYREWRASQDDRVMDSLADVDIEEVDEQEAASTAFEEASERAWLQVRDYLMGMDAYDFQDLVAALLKAMDYHVNWISPPGPDRGLDILAFTDPLGATGPRIKVQVKRRQDKTSADGLRSFMAILGPGDVGIYISAGGFTPDAEREARSQENRRITLIDLERLYDLWVEFAEKLSEQEQSLLPLKPVYYLALQ